MKTNLIRLNNCLRCEKQINRHILTRFTYKTHTWVESKSPHGDDEWCQSNFMCYDCHDRIGSNCHRKEYKQLMWMIQSALNYKHKSKIEIVFSRIAVCCKYIMKVLTSYFIILVHNLFYVLIL
jgi:hypothetical protein